jgi:hypothetical protein
VLPDDVLLGIFDFCASGTYDYDEEAGARLPKVENCRLFGTTSTEPADCLHTGNTDEV